MSDATMHRRKALTSSQLRDLKAELTRESRRFAPDDPRNDAFAAAMHRIENGSYGYCARCAGPIPHDRLVVMPETVFCVECRKDRS